MSIRDIFIFVFGAVMTSYLQVVIQSGFWDSIIRRRSVCDYCLSELKFYQIIPIISYFLLCGQSPCCQKRVQTKYLFAEILGGLSAVYIFYLYENHNYFYMCWVVFLTVCMIYDISCYIVPNRIMGIFFIYLFFIQRIDIYKLLLLSVVIICILFSNVINFIGGADIKIIALLIYSFPLIDVMIILLYASTVALIFIIIVKTRDKKIPFVPFLFIGFLMAFII